MTTIRRLAGQPDPVGSLLDTVAMMEERSMTILAFRFLSARIPRGDAYDEFWRPTFSFSVHSRKR
jgi:hypothetical protein